MEIQKTMLSAETRIGGATAQAQLESAIPLPNGVRSEKVLSCEPDVRVHEALCTRDGVQVNGLLSLHLVVETDAETPLSFDASATFSHALSLAGVTPEMTARAAAYAPACSCRMEDGGLRMQATLLLRAEVFASERQSCIAGVDDAKGLETQGETIRLTRRTLLGAHAIRLRETVDAPEDVSLLKASGTAEVGRVANGPSGVLLEGTLFGAALYYDGEGGAISRPFALPFSDTLDAEPSTQLSATAEVTQLDVSYDPDGSLTVDAAISVAVYGVAEETACVISDAYDSTGGFSCETKSVPCLNYVGEQFRTTTLREPIQLPDYLKDATRVLCAAAAPAITDTAVSEDAASIDGLLLLSIVYRADDGRLYGFRTDLPFSLPLDPMGTLLLPEVAVRTAEASGSGRTLSCAVELRYGGEWYRQQNVLLTTDLLPGAPRDPHEGILVYFPDPGETIFSIGKRFGVPTASIRAQNPSLSDPLPDGASVLLLRG